CSAGVVGWRAAREFRSEGDDKTRGASRSRPPEGPAGSDVVGLRQNASAYLRQRYQTHEARPPPPRTNSPVPGSGKLPPPPPPGGRLASAAEADVRPNNTASVRPSRIRIRSSHRV